MKQKSWFPLHLSTIVERIFFRGLAGTERHNVLPARARSVGYNQAMTFKYVKRSEISETKFKSTRTH